MRRPLLPQPLLKTLQRGLAIGANRHTGLASTWSWVVDYLTRAKEFFATSVNDGVGDINIVAGEGINVTTNGSTITISAGGGTNSKTGGGGSSDGGGSSGSGSEYFDAADFAGFSFDDVTFDQWVSPEYDTSDDEGAEGCNSVGSSDEQNEFEDTPINEGDDCETINN